MKTLIDFLTMARTSCKSRNGLLRLFILALLCLLTLPVTSEQGIRRADASEQVAAKAAASNFTITYSYDALGRLTKAAYSDGMLIEYTYDANGNRTAQKVTGASARTPGDFDNDGTVEFPEVVRVIDAYFGRLTLTDAERTNLGITTSPPFAVVINIIDTYFGR
jgi:YD repeat-containing protein